MRSILTAASTAFVLAGVGCLAVAARLGQLAERRWS